MEFETDANPWMARVAPPVTGAVPTPMLEVPSVNRLEAPTLSVPDRTKFAV
jgi:hypothetical protein